VGTNASGGRGGGGVRDGSWGNRECLARSVRVCPGGGATAGRSPQDVLVSALHLPCGSTIHVRASDGVVSRATVQGCKCNGAGDGWHDVRHAGLHIDKRKGGAGEMRGGASEGGVGGWGGG
jgi:hypothetical protein